MKLFKKMEKTITGCIDNKKIQETISNYQSNIPEQVSTAQKNIRRKFEKLGYDPDKVTFY